MPSPSHDAMTGRLPNYSFIEPRYFSSIVLNRMPNDQHSPHNVAYGERLIARCYDALRNGAGWAETLFIVIYDEHGGLYDHVAPPKAVPPDCTDGFTFDRYGVRVPAVPVSPWIPTGSIVRPPMGSQYPFDHTSILATLRSLFGLRTPLTERDAVAPDFLHALSLSEPTNNGPSSLALPLISPSNAELQAAHQAPPNAPQRALAEAAAHLPSGAANVTGHAMDLATNRAQVSPSSPGTVAEALDQVQADLDRFLTSPRRRQ